MNYLLRIRLCAHTHTHSHEWISARRRLPRRDIRYTALAAQTDKTRRLLVFSCAALAAAADALVTLGFGLFQGDQSPPHAQIPAAHAAAQQLTIFLAFCVRSSYKRRGSLDYLLCKNASEVVAAAQSSEDKVA
jgi:hypothetical protein